jgi:hypothetical protein
LRPADFGTLGYLGSTPKHGRMYIPQSPFTSTDTWSAKNKREFIAVTIHYIDYNAFENTSSILDVVELIEPTHSGSYISNKLFKITEYYSISIAIITISYSNARPNNSLLQDFKGKVQAKFEKLSEYDQAQYSLRFKASNGDIRCFAHIINLSVQAGKYL